MKHLTLYDHCLPLKRMILVAASFFILTIHAALANDANSYVSFRKDKNNFSLVSGGKAASLLIDENDYPGVIKALKDLQADIERVSSVKPELSISRKIEKRNEVVIVGTIGKSTLIDNLIKNKKLDVSGIKGKWETHIIQVIEKPVKGVDRALVIAGSDKRGTIFGIYDVSAEIGVSPWYWWADVPVMKHENIYIKPGRHSKGEPKVKYRGIFINDEAPAMSGWTWEKFGGFNSKMYVHVFELILRLKGNFLWPAMWGNAFYVDDPLNPRIADEYGVVIGTSHHEPLMRAHSEWKKFGEGPWNYETNKDVLTKFWKESVERTGDFESLFTIGMRGDGDEPMSEESNIALLEKIVTDQRKIINEVTGKDASETPQVWALYKEVQEYYDKGMRVPEDVTLLLCDDNWGNIRKLPKPDDKPRKGGYGIYYHYDYVGGPRNYKWLNTNPIARVWEQMHLAYRHGVDRIWIVNVGDIKPMEFPISFFLDFAWDPELYPAGRLPEYTREWAEKQFGKEYASQIAKFLTKYTMFNGRRKPELLSPYTYSLLHYREAETIVEEYNELYREAKAVYDLIPADAKDAYYQLVLHPIEACSNLNNLYLTVGKNRLYAKQGRVLTNELAEKARQLFERDAAISRYYNKEMANGKWNHMMDQTHIGYTYWQQPEKDVMPEVSEISLPSTAEMGISIEGSDLWWPAAKEEAVLKGFSPFATYVPFFEIFNRGTEPFDFLIESGASWLKTSKTTGNVKSEERIFVEVDWNKVPEGFHKIPLTVAGAKGKKMVVYAEVNNKNLPDKNTVKGFVESSAYISIEAENFSNKIESDLISWKVIPNLGRTKSGVTAFPVTTSNHELKKNSPRLEYNLYLLDSGNVEVRLFLSPTLNYYNNQGLRIAVSFDNEEPQIINMHTDDSLRTWEQWVSDNVNVQMSKHHIKEPGEHVLKVWFIDAGVVLQKLVIDTGGLKPSYLGPSESYKADQKSLADN